MPKPKPRMLRELSAQEQEQVLNRHKPAPTNPQRLNIRDTDIINLFTIDQIQSGNYEERLME